MTKKKKVEYKVRKGLGTRSYVEASADGKKTLITVLGEASEEELKRIFHKDPKTMARFIDGNVDQDYLKAKVDNKPGEAAPVAPKSEDSSTENDPK